MIDWLRSLTPETIIIFASLLVIFTLTIMQLLRLKKIASRVGEQEFYINESLLEIEGEPYINLTIINKAFSTNHINVIGVELRNVSHPLEEKLVMIAPRSKHQTRFNLNDIKRIVFQNKRTYRPFKIYVENEIGLRKTLKPKVNNKFMKREFNKMVKAEKREKKRKRFESGQYKFSERIGLIIGLFFRPFAKFFRHMALSTNKALRESEIRRLQKKEHDIVKYKLDQDVHALNEIRIKEQAIKENRTRELELEALKTAKELEIEQIKKQTLEAEFLAKKTEIEAINPEKEAQQALLEEKVQYEKEQKALEKQTKKQKKQQEVTQKSEEENSVPTEETPVITADQSQSDATSDDATDATESKPKRKRRTKKKTDDVEETNDQKETPDNSDTDTQTNEKV